MISGDVKPTTSPPKQDPAIAPTLVITISASGALIVGSDVVQDADLEARLRKVDKALRVMVSADKSVPQTRIGFVVDTAKKAGLTKVGIGTPSKDTPVIKTPPPSKPVPNPGPVAPPTK